MSPRRAVLITLAAVCLLLVAAAPAAAVTFTIPTGKTDRCLECHSKPDLGTIEVNGAEKTLTVDQSAWHDSVHSRMDCTSCHANQPPTSASPTISTPRSHGQIARRRGGSSYS